MSIKPILFNTDMVRAILAGEKTQTRRLIKPQPRLILNYVACSSERKAERKWTYPSSEAWKVWDDDRYKVPDDLSEEEKEQLWTPPADADDILWVRETWSTTDKCGLYPNWPTDGIHYMYKADDPTCDAAKEARWYPSIHMPKQAARIFLRVKNVRVERLQGITSYDCVKEGISKDVLFAIKEKMTKGIFATLWESTLKKADLPKYGWDANPLVWVIEFERCEKPEGWCAE